MGYIKDLRKKIGTAPIMMVGACVLIFNEQRQLLLQNELITIAGDLQEARWNLAKPSNKSLHAKC